MKDYARQRVADIATVLMGQSPPSAVCAENGDGLPFIQRNAEFGRRFPKPRLRCSVPTRVAELGDLLVSVRAPVGEVNQASTRMVIGRGLCAVRFRCQDTQYAWHALRWAVSQLNRAAQGSTFVAVSRQDVEGLGVPWPEHEANRSRIAAVLDTLDAAIAKTEAVIAKLKCVRAGLIHDLLTRGVDSDGQLRPLPGDAPQEYQNSPLGPVPKEWHISTVGDEFPLQRGFDITVSGQREGDVPVVSSSGITSYHDTAMVRGPGVVTGRKGKLG
ncbi:MAG: restriction endonuclease subunit S, partial [Planctomycetota bacterium]